LTEDTVFWVVKPRLFAGNISGLETVLSGSYIGMVPGPAKGKAQRAFAGKEDPPILQANVPGRIFLLKAKRLGSISVGSPVFFRDLSIGEVLGWDIADMAESVTIRAFVRSPYDTYVHAETRFWNASGVSIKLGATGIDVQLESLKALILGGIAFDTPVSEAQSPAIAENHVFPLFADHDAANSASYTRTISVVSYFPGSVRGLGPGSEVTMHGLLVGHVTSVRLSYDQKEDAIVAPVHFEVQPERIVGIGARVFKSDDEAVNALLKRGLRASLQSASLITGQQNVALDFVKDAPPVPVTKEGEYFVLPTTEGGGFAGLASSANDLLDKVNTIPFDVIGKSLSGILQQVDETVHDPETRKAVAEVAATIASIKEVAANLNTGSAPALRRLPELTAGAERTMTNANKLMLSIDSGYGDNTKFNRDLDRLMVQANDAVMSMRALADLLARHPEALVKGRPAGGTE
jgi:paraquat-inducible protein B